MSKTTLIKPLDLVTFGAPGVIATALTIYAYTQGISGSPLALLIVTSAAFLAIYVALVCYRYSLISKITFTTKHGLHIIDNGFPVDKAEVEAVTETTIHDWSAILSPDRCQDSISELVVSFEQYPIYHNTMGKLAGYAIGDNVVVGFKKPLDSTALAHELGHFIYKEYSGVFDNKQCHAFMKEHGLK